MSCGQVGLPVDLQPAEEQEEPGLGVDDPHPSGYFAVVAALDKEVFGHAVPVARCPTMQAVPVPTRSCNDTFS